MTPSFQSPATLRLPNPAFEPKIPLGRLDVIWILLTVSLMAHIGNYFAEERFAFLAHFLAISSCISCGISWLLARALFRETQSDEYWTYGVVGILFVIGCTLYVTRQMGIPRNGILGFIAEVSMLISSTMLLLPIFEAIDGFLKKDRTERVFRTVFLATYGLVLSAALIVSMPVFAGIEHTAQVVLCIVVLFGTAIAVQHRKRLDARERQSSVAARRTDTNIEHIARTLTALLEKERVFLQADMKVGDLARKLGEPQYKVTRAITGPLGFSNFNQMINDYRIGEAKKLLADARSKDLSILCIAMDSGFGSIGPFNRAFKQRTGITPLEFRKSFRDRAHAV